MKIILSVATIIFPILFVACSPTQENANALNNKTTSKINFVDATESSGLIFKHVAGYSPEKWMPEVLAAGVAVADFNRDGAPDILLTNSGKFGEERPADAKNAIFINDGKGKFSNRSAEWNLGGSGYGQGVGVGDIDNDGLIDVLLTNYEGDSRLLKNTGEKFEDITETSGIKRDNKWATSAGMADFDNDGDLDIFIVRYVNYTKSNHQKTFSNKMLTYSAPYLYQGVSDQLLRNDGNGKFTDVSETSGIAASSQKGLALAIGDIDKDGDQDVYVANDTTPNQLWVNDGSGKFKDAARISGCAYSENGKEEGSMGADFSDFDGNKLIDIAVTNFQDEPTAVYSQTEPLFFREVSDAIGIGQTSRQRLSFGIDFFDADNDGDEDLLIANGHIEDNIEKRLESVSFPQQNSLFENSGDGKFLDISDSSGDALQDKQVSRGLAVADFDSDGNLDFVVANNNGMAQVAHNESSSNGKFVGLWLEGIKANRSAIGTRLVATIGEKLIERQIMGAQSYLSVSDFRIIFGLVDSDKIDELKIYWAGSSPQIIKNLPAGKFYYIREGKEPMNFIPGEKQIKSEN